MTLSAINRKEAHSGRQPKPFPVFNLVEG